MSLGTSVPRSLDSGIARCRTVLQMESVECGAAALAMVLNHYGRDVSLDELREQVGVSRNGSRADLIVAAGHLNGLNGEGRAVNANQLKSMPGPVIAFWENNHYVVVEGFTNGMWHLNDPAIGRREVTDEEFSRSFSDVALTFAPNADFVRNHRSLRSYVSWLLLRLRGSRRAVVYAIIAGTLEVIPTLMIAFLAGVFVTQILAPKSSGGLVGLVAILVAMGVAGMILASLKSLVIFRLHTKLVVRFGTDYLW
ncbi:MAG: cysteine peptidase family C39 domain-containing protein, partial [bacterium]|nr:cysteine peptidase family C39 domain-containing protein [bacterium]